ncbi:putative RNA-directed DNA polymerase [Helianthus annuus]|nr:putative RNA-directed DNA polymerase [Helianthus annuus]
MVAQELVVLKLLIKDLNQKVVEKVTVYCDNISSIYLANNLMFRARLKHIEVHYHFNFIRQKLLEGEVDLKYIDTQMQVADVFTKSLAAGKLESFCEKINMKQTNIEGEY